MVAQIDSNYKSYGLGKVARRALSYGLFEGRPHTTKGQWFNPVIFSFLRLLKSVPGTPSINKPIFITGLGRSGTTILGVILSLHRDVGFLNEPKAMWHLIDPRHDVNGDYSADNGFFKLDTDDVTSSVSVTARRLFGRYLYLTKSKRLVDKYPELIFRVNYLLKIFPDAKIIFIVRNGADATHSINLWSKRLGIKNKAWTEDWWGRNDIKWNYLRQQILFKDNYFDEISNIATAELDHTNRAALEWIVTMREGIKQKSTHSASIFQIRYEDLSSPNSSAIKNILDWCELDFDNTVLDYSDKTLHSNQSKAHPTLLPPIDFLFNETMELLGY
ncbi:MAG: sulfotransferase [Candidatus Thiodiazotropha sp.]